MTYSAPCCRVRPHRSCAEIKSKAALWRSQSAAKSNVSEIYFAGADGAAGAGAFGLGLIGVAGRGIAVPAPEPVVEAAGGVVVLLAVLVVEPPQ